MDIKDVIKSQYHAALAMLEQTIAQCPDALWESSASANRFWHVAYHVLFYTHLYLQHSEKEFAPWTKHRHESQFLGPLPWPPHKKPTIGEPYTREEVLEYLEFCRGEVDATVNTLNLEGESGFSWLPFSKMELQFYNLRHLQHHTGELAERLGNQGIEIQWVGMKPA
jgi:hypothetical protein